MRIEELLEKLANIGVDVSPKTLRRWADKGLITNHSLNVGGRGKGNAEDWPSKALEEAAAVGAIKKVAGKRLSTITVKGIRIIGQRVFRTPQVEYEWSLDYRLAAPLPAEIPSDFGETREYSYRDLKTKPVDDDAFSLFDRLVALYDGARPFPDDERLFLLLGDDEVLDALGRFTKHRETNDLVIILERIIDVRVQVDPALVTTWVTAIIKARHCVKITQPKRVVFHWYSWPSVEDAKGFVRGDITLEELPADDQSANEELLVFVDEIDMRKKVFYVPFDEWDPLKLIGL